MDTRFFVVCDECEGHIFQHEGFTEVSGVCIDFNVTCPNCKAEFIYRQSTQKGRHELLRRNEQIAAGMIKMLNPKNMARLIKGTMKELQKPEDGDHAL